MAGFDNSPRCTGIVDQNGQPVGALLHLGNQSVAPGLVLEVGDNVLALSGAQCIQTRGGRLQVLLLPAGDDDTRAVLDEALGCHLAQSRGTARDEHDVVAGIEQVADREVDV